MSLPELTGHSIAVPDTTWSPESARPTSRNCSLGFLERIFGCRRGHRPRLQQLLCRLQLEAFLIGFQERAQGLRRVQQAHPLLVVQRHGEAAEAVHADPALLADFEV